MTLTAGTKLGPYEIVSLVGSGGMGEVYRARDTRLGREVAVKVLPEALTKDADRLRRFEQEARAVAALNHPNILAIHDIGEQDGRPYLVSELLEGGSLRALLADGALPARKATDYAVQIAQGLAAAHEKNIIHRDLKPENLFITREGRAKILDFGLAKLIVLGNERDGAVMTMTSLPTEAGLVMGTAGYMAPEQVRGAGVDSRTDIFAFGAVLYEMVAGRRAFQRDTAAETMTAILKEEPPELSESLQPVSPGLERIIRRCLEKQPEKRFQSAKDLAFALEALSGSTTTSSKSMAAAAEAAGAATAAEKTKRRNWVGFAAGVVLGVIATAGLAWGLLRPAPAQPATFTRVSFEEGTVLRGRLAADGKTVVYTAQLNGGAPDTYVIRDEYPESVPAGLNGAVLVALSRQGQMAVLVRPKYFAHYQFFGTLATAPLGGGAPREILEDVFDADWSPDGKEMAVIFAKNHHFRLEYPVGKVLWEGENWISDVRVSPDGSQVAYFRHPPNSDDRGDVMVADRSGNPRVIGPGWATLEALAWAPSGKEVWFSGGLAGDATCIQAATLAAKQRTVYCGTTSTRVHDVAASGRVLVSSDQERESMYLVERGKAARDVSWLDSDYNPRLTSDGSMFLFTDQSVHAGQDYAVYVRKTDGSPAVKIGGGGYGSDISPDGKWALIVLGDDPQGRIQVVPVGPGEAKALHWDGFHPLWASWCPDGSHIMMFAVQDGKGTRAFLTDAAGSVPKQLSIGEINVAGSKASPDMQQFYTRGANGWVLTSMMDGKTQPMTGLKEGEFPLGWGTDAKHVFTVVRGANGMSISRLELGTGKREAWLEWKPKQQVGLGTWKAPASVTPDGRWVAFTYGAQLGQLYRSENLK